MIDGVCRIGLLCCVIWIGVSSADDMVMQLFPNRPVNYVNEKFISFSISPAELERIFVEKRSEFASKLRELGASNLKILANSFSQLKVNHDKASDTSKTDFGDWLFEATKNNDGMKLVIPLPYDSRQWKPREVIKMLGEFAKIDVNNVVWQLGSEFHVMDAMKYIDDLTTLRTIVDVFASMNKNQSWSVIGSDLTIGSNVNEARLFSELSRNIVQAIGWTQSLESLHPEKSVDNVFDESAVDIALDTILSSDTPVWLTLAQLNNQTSATNSLAKGLNWARTLGDASRIGFKMIYAPIDQQEWFEPTLSYYTTLLHKRLMGRTVLDSNLLNGNQFNTHMYTHCTPNSNGAFVIYGVNMADSEANVQVKMPPIRSGSDYKEYVLTVNQYSGKVQLNGIDIVEGRPLIPINKPKRLALPAHLSLPARSVGFWVFSNAELPACERNLDEEPLRLPTLPKTSSEELLQLLIREDIQRDDDMEKNPISRMRVDGHRMRRSVPNAIEKEHKINSIQQNAHVNDNEIHKRDRRSIDDDMAAARSRRADNLLLNEFEAMKQQQINLPFAAKMDTATGLKRPKRQIGNALTRLMEKIELKKPSFNLKPPTFKLPQIALPPITAVHDIYPPNSAERRVFHSVENPNLPAGDVHFDFEEMANGAPNPANANYEPQPQNGPGPINREIQEVPMVNDPVRDGMPEDLNVPNTPDQYYESLFGDAPIALTPPPLVQPYHHMPPAEMGPPPPARYEELWEMDAAQMPPMPSLAPKQSNQPQEAPVNTNIDFVVKETQPTWQKNQENLQKARESLQKFYPPASKISSLLMNVARPQNFRSPFFDSTETRRRRRRSIDAEMNEEIERRVKELGVKRPQAKDSGEYNNLDSAIEKLSILDRALKIVAEMDRSEHRESETDFGKISTELKKLGEIVAQNAGSAALLPPPPSTSNDIELHKQCKIMSKSMEQRCLREPARPFVTLMKHVTDTTAKKVAGPIKKLLSRVQANQRNKRSADEVILENDIRLNEIPTEIFGDVKVADFVKMPYVRIEEKPAPKGLIEEELPKILNAIKGTFDRLVTTATDQMTTWWSNLG